MILTDIRDYLKQRGQCTLNDIALHFDSDADAMRGMLEVWVGKGKVKKIPATAPCGSRCQSCEPAATEIYLWCEQDRKSGTGDKTGVSVITNCKRK